MKIRKKSIIIFVASLIISIFVIPLIFKVYFSIAFSTLELKKTVVDFFKFNLDRAIKFEDISIDYMGDIVISNIYLSMTSDFNDNLSLLESRRMIIKTHFFTLFKGSLVIDGFYCNKNVITLIKKYSKNYREFFDKIKSLKDQKKLFGNIDFNSLRFRFNDSTVHYIESYKDKKVSLTLSDINIKANVSSDHIRYSVNGYINHYKSKVIDKGELSWKGIYTFQGKKENSVYIENFDLSYLNDFYKKYDIMEKSLYGGLTVKIKSSTIKNNTRVHGTIEANNINLVSIEKTQKNIITNENATIAMDLHFNHDFNVINLARFDVNSDSVSIKTSGLYKKDNKSEIIKISFGTNEINLKDLSGSFTPFAGARYSGTLSSSINIEYDLKNKKNIQATGAVRFKKFNLKRLENGQLHSLISNGNASVAYTNNKLSANADFNSNKSDIKLRIESDIKKIDPLQSATTITVDSKTLELSLLYNLVTVGADTIYKEAYIDRKKGYEQIFFLNLPTGKLLNANDISCTVKAKHLLVQNNAKMENFVFDIQMQNGFLQLKDFKLSGYDGNYALNINGQFNRDMPFFGFAGHIKEFDLERFYKDAGYAGEMKGKLQMDFEFELVANRLAQLLENTKSKCNISVGKSLLKQTGLQKQFNAFLKSNKYATIDDNIELDRFSISFSQVGQYFFIMNFSAASAIANFGAYGNYEYYNGLKVPVYLNVKNVENKYLTIPLLVHGELQNPCISILNMKDSKSLCFDLR